MNFGWFALAGVHTLARLVLEGRIERRHWWVALRGAERWVRAIAAGDVADDAAARSRVAVCDRCEACTREGLDALAVPVTKMYCGPALEDRTGKAEPTCGCLVGLTVEGVADPAGKTMVRSERCPRGKW